MKKLIVFFGVSFIALALTGCGCNGGQNKVDLIPPQTVDLILPQTVDLIPPQTPTISLINNASSKNITKDGLVVIDGIIGSVLVEGIDSMTKLSYLLPNSTSWTEINSNTFDIMKGVYNPGDIKVRQVDAAGNQSIGSNQDRWIIVPQIAINLGDIETNSNNSSNNGFVMHGAKPGNRAGYYVSGAGDVNGDGLDDVVVSAYTRNFEGIHIGASYVVFGKKDGDEIDLEAIEFGLGGFTLKGVASDDYSGYSLSGAGDVNGDGLDDVAVASYARDFGGFNRGAVYVVFGKTDTAFFELNAIESGVGGFVVRGIRDKDFVGSPVSGRGDINGDGLDDIIIAATGRDIFVNRDGTSYVIFGKTNTAAIDLINIESGSNDGFAIKPTSNSGTIYSGFSLSTGGDFNGDGFDDFIISAPNNSSGTTIGRVYVVFGGENNTNIDLGSIENNIGGFVIKGIDDDSFGSFVSGGGDINGDGLDDIIVGAYGKNFDGLNLGAGYVIFGTTNTTNIDLKDIDAGVGGFVVKGIDDYDNNGGFLSHAGDINGDGLEDMIFGVKNKDFPEVGDQVGASYVVFGKTDTNEVDLLDIEYSVGGFVINGISSEDEAGRSVSGAGDVNGDGFADIIIGAHKRDVKGTNSGSSYVVFGGAGTISATTIGTESSDNFIGSNIAEQFITGEGDDVIASYGPDVIHAGPGDDILNVYDSLFKLLNGGNGIDTLVIRNSLNLDLTTIANNKLQNIEVIDLNSQGGMLTLGLDDAIHMVGSEAKNILTIKGTSVDTVNLSGDFTDTGNDEAVDGITYDVFKNSGTRNVVARLYVQQGIQINP